MNLATLLRETATRLPEKVALIVDVSGERLTFAQLDAEADRVSSALHGGA